MLVTLLSAPHSALKELDTTLITHSHSGPNLAPTQVGTPSKQDWRLFPGSWASLWGLQHFASSLGPQFPCLYNRKVDPDGFQGCLTLRPQDLDAQYASLWYLDLEGLQGWGCPGVVGVTPSSVRATLIAETRTGN